MQPHPDFPPSQPVYPQQAPPFGEPWYPQRPGPTSSDQQSIYPQQVYPQQAPPFGEQWRPQQGSMPPGSQAFYPPLPTGQPMQGYPAQQQPSQYPPQSFAPYPPPPIPQVNTVVNVNVQRQGSGFLMRALYFVFVGWWLGYLWLNIGFALCAFIVTLPLGLIMLNRLPQVLTLRSQGQQTNVQVATAMTAGGVTNVVNVNISGAQQHNMLIRVLYFLLVGWWVGYIWPNIGYFFCLTVLGLPLGLLMLNRLPLVLTLRKN